MNELSELERILITRGDTAIVLLKALRNLLAPALATNTTTFEQLSKIQSKQPQGQQTLLSVVTQVAEKNVETLQTAVETIENTLAELDAFVEQTGVDISTDNAIDNIVEAIRNVSDVYTDKTDEEIKAILRV